MEAAIGRPSEALYSETEIIITGNTETSEIPAFKKSSRVNFGTHYIVSKKEKFWQKIFKRDYI